jgi:hypothetical protein
MFSEWRGWLWAEENAKQSPDNVRVMGRLIKVTQIDL